MKQLDIEQAEEMPSSTLTSAEAVTSCHVAPVLPQRLQISSDSTVEEGEIVTETDMPPLTGQTSCCELRFGLGGSNRRPVRTAAGCNAAL